ncbi:MAG: hypothetical protein D6778_08290 [Nitrospirae bacterium]|nr:MAG: hypothetical protein D6778_08290 [Nitrospirota bacterium]
MRARLLYIILCSLILSAVLPSGTLRAQTSYKEFIPYTPKIKRDPFVSPIEITKKKIQKVKRKTLSPLESYDLEEIRVIGIVFDGKQYLASVVLPDGKGFTVKKGMRIGINGGKIIRITENAILVREYFPDYITGQLKPRDRTMKLHKEEGK